ncbi:hypothetical protein [Actinomyces viscosus]|uniref:hypothetical protein n=1 Tax=Actinomyces viscosus TaxID=1656 RepID=UPI0028ED66AC|nr:hypothetical protein [Actinomyces viscosus]
MIAGEIVGGLGTAWRHRWIAMGVAVMFTVVSVVLTMTLAEVITQASVATAAQHLRERDAVTFTPYYLGEPLNDPSTALMEDLGSRISAGSAYTIVVGNVQTGDPSFAGGNPVVLVVGSAAQNAITGTRLCSPAPCAMVGETTAHPASGPLVIGGRSVPVTGRTPSSASLFDPAGVGIDLGRSVLIVLPPSSLDHLDSAEQEEAVWRTVLLAPTDEVSERFITAARQDRLALVPHRLAADQPERFRELMVWATMHGIGLLALTVLASIAYGSSIRSVLRRERAELLLRHLHGATPTQIAARLAAFLAATMLVLPSLVLLAFAVNPLLRGVAAVTGAGLTIIYLGFLLITVRRVRARFSRSERAS